MKSEGQLEEQNNLRAAAAVREAGRWWTKKLMPWSPRHAPSRRMVADRDLALEVMKEINEK